MQPYAFFSHTTVECNYDVGNRELQSFNIWTFTIWTDHKHITHLKTTKRLNAHQPAGLSFLVIYIFPFPIIQVPTMSSPMSCHTNSPPTQISLRSQPYSLPSIQLATFPGTWRKSSARLFWMSPFPALVLPTIATSPWLLAQ